MSEVFATILKSQGHTISIETKFDANGNNFRVLVGDVPLELFLESQPIGRVTVLRQFVVHDTRIFNNIVQTFIQKIVMSKYEGCLPVLFLSYRVEMQLRGMAHIHGCLWLDEAFLRDCSFSSEQQLIVNTREVRMSSQQYFSQRIMNKNPRFAENSSYLSAAQQRVEREQLERQCDNCFRKRKTKRLDNDTVKVSQDDIQTVFQRIRGTSQYWRVARNELIAKVKKLGPFQYFFTLSCAEMRCPRFSRRF